MPVAERPGAEKSTMARPSGDVIVSFVKPSSPAIASNTASTSPSVALCSKRALAESKDSIFSAASAVTADIKGRAKNSPAAINRLTNIDPFALGDENRLLLDGKRRFIYDR